MVGPTQQQQQMMMMGGSDFGADMPAMAGYGGAVGGYGGAAAGPGGYPGGALLQHQPPLQACP